MVAQQLIFDLKNQYHQTQVHTEASTLTTLQLKINKLLCLEVTVSFTDQMRTFSQSANEKHQHHKQTQPTKTLTSTCPRRRYLSLSPPRIFALHVPSETKLNQHAPLPPLGTVRLSPHRYPNVHQLLLYQWRSCNNATKNSERKGFSNEFWSKPSPTEDARRTQLGLIHSSRWAVLHPTSSILNTTYLASQSRRSLNLIGVLFLHIKFNNRSSKQMVYISRNCHGFYLSQTAMKDLNIVPYSFPQQSSSAAAANMDEDECHCLEKTDAPNRPQHMPFESIPANIPKLKK